MVRLVILSFILQLFLFSSCIKEEIIKSDLLTSDVSFNLRIGDFQDNSLNTTKIDEVPIFDDVNGCKGIDELSLLAAKGSLFLEIVLSRNTYSSDPVLYEIKLPVIMGYNPQRLISKSVSLTNGKYQLRSAKLCNSSPEKFNPLYSGVPLTSKFASYIPNGKHLDEYEIEIMKEMSFQISDFDLWMICCIRLGYNK